MWKSLAAMALSLTVAGAAPARCDLAARDAGGAGKGCQRAWMDRNLRLNDLVTVGTHNSYKTEIPAPVLAAIRAVTPRDAQEIDYRHRPLTEQFDAGVRQLEIDIYDDPEGGRFGDPAGLRAVGLSLDPAHRAALMAPGFKVMHIQDIDVLSTCATLKACLSIVRTWSRAHPDHVPMLLMFNLKSGKSDMPGGVAALPFDAAAFDALDREVRAIFPPDALITPDDVQGDYPTLRDAVLHNGWPTLGAARGRLLFALDEGPETYAPYLAQDGSLKGRVFFVNAPESASAAAYLTLNDPVGDAARIRQAVAAGFIVRTRADAGTLEARANDGRRRAAALASGAQFVSTDYYWPEPRLANDYEVRLADGAVALCNPVRAAGRCAGYDVESGALAARARRAGAAAGDALPRAAQPGPGAALDRRQKVEDRTIGLVQY
jgi:hypothetical protein